LPMYTAPGEAARRSAGAVWASSSWTKVRERPAMAEKKSTTHRRAPRRSRSSPRGPREKLITVSVVTAKRPMALRA